MSSSPDVLYVNLSPNAEPTEIESCCMNCLQKGITKLLMIKIPFFKEVIIQSFNCDKCGYTNNEVTQGSQIAEQGQKIIFNVTQKKDLSRQIIKSENCSIKIVELDFEIPSNKKGYINTIEGYIKTSVEELSLLQDERKIKQPDVAEKIQTVLDNLEDYADGNVLPFTIEIDDPSGTSFLENIFAPQQDPNMREERYTRSIEQLQAMGYYADNALGENQNDENTEHENLEKKIIEKKDKALNEDTEFKEVLNQAKYTAHRLDFVKPLVDDQIKGELSQFEINCHACGRLGTQKMCLAAVPYFKELIVMAFTCDFCGARSSEVKPGGGISKLGKKMTFNIEKPEDFNRDCFKSDSASVLIPEIDLELVYGTLGGLYTTIEGLLDKTLTNLKDNCPFVGDSTATEQSSKLTTFLDKLESLLKEKRPFKLIIDDPLDNSFIQNPLYPKDDPQIEIEIYKRSDEQDDFFGIKQMKTHNY